MAGYAEDFGGNDIIFEKISHDILIDLSRNLGEVVPLVI